MATDFDDDRDDRGNESSHDSRLPGDTQVGESTTPNGGPRAGAARQRLARGSAPVDVPSDDVAPPPEPAADADDLVRAALAAGDGMQAMTIVVQTYGLDVYRCCRRMLGNTDDSNDVSQNVFVQAFRGLKDLERVHNVRSWLLGIARHRCIDWLRVRRRASKLFEHRELCDIADHHAGGDIGSGDPGIRKALDGCLDRLAADRRAILILRFHDGLSFPEISKLLSETAGALRVRLVRALVALRKCLEGKGIRP